MCRARGVPQHKYNPPPSGGSSIFLVVPHWSDKYSSRRIPFKPGFSAITTILWATKYLFGFNQSVQLFLSKCIQTSSYSDKRNTSLTSKHAFCFPDSYNLAHCVFHPEFFSISQNSSHLLRPSTSATFPIKIKVNI